ncbi:hydrolase TatD [Desulfosarcina widdelii]|uniref:Hydrolase TatD n=1 Tax=Desulfosarcina widdelii TaxID=947919 RepID=A0A5K7Z8C5_9BACT|nr:TatD family hydrolase [Desulfosarcina widdelii]BBO76113.1 hydrolase TatD [Desulfosarcina widdelii]
MKLFDSHCHLDDAVFKPDFEKILQRAAKADVKRMMIAGIDEHTSARAVELAESFPEVYASVGVHPHDARSCSEKTLRELSSLSLHPKVMAWGEIGLDFNRMYSPQKDQEHWFVRQLEIADRLELPLIFHERDSQGRFLEILEATPAKDRRAVVHCFSGSTSELVRYLDMGFYIGITGIVTIAKRGKTLRDMLPRIPKNRLLIETDAPYLTPTPQRNRHRRNEPAFVRQVLTKVAEVLGEDLQSLAQQVWTNTCTLFCTDPSTD